MMAPVFTIPITLLMGFPTSSSVLSALGNCMLWGCLEWMAALWEGERELAFIKHLFRAKSVLKLSQGLCIIWSSQYPER